MTQDEALFRPRQAPSPRDLETAPQRIRLARRDASLYLHTLADWLHAGFISATEVDAEVAALFAQLAERFSLTPNDSLVAMRSEWHEASRAAAKRVDAVGSVIRRLAWEDAPTARILEAAEAAVERSRASFGNSHIEALIIDICRPIAEARARRAKRGKRP